MKDAGILLARSESLASEQQIPEWRALMMVLLEEISSVKDELPEVAKGAYFDALHYWTENRSNVEVLADAKERCWADIVANKGLGDHERLTRAVLCVLEPDGDSEYAGDIAEWFVAMLR